MGIFNKNKNKNKDNKFAELNYISNGDIYQKQMEMIAQDEINFANMQAMNMANNVNGLIDKLTNAMNTKFSQYQIPEYYLMMIYADYFCGLTNYIIYNNQYNLEVVIKQLVKLAFLNGKAMLFYDKNKNMFIPLEIVKINYNIDLTIRDIDVMYINDKNWEEEYKPNNYDKNKSFKIYGTQQKDFFIFRWVHEFSAWIYFWPFVKLNRALLSIMNINAFLKTKKMIINVNNKNQIVDDYLALFNENLGVIVNTAGASMGNDVEYLKLGDTIKDDNFVDLYNQVIQTYYKIFSIRNFAAKSARAVVDEVYNTDGMVNNFEAQVQKEYSLMFQFIEFIFNRYNLGEFNYKVNGSFTDNAVYNKMKAEKSAEIDLQKVKNEPKFAEVNAFNKFKPFNEGEN